MAMKATVAALNLVVMISASSLRTASRSSTNTQGFEECPAQKRFDIIMCDSHMCTECTLAWCTETCQKVQLMFPECKCSSWPEARTSYSGGDFVGKGSFGDKGDYSTAGAESS